MKFSDIRERAMTEFITSGEPQWRWFMLDEHERLYWMELARVHLEWERVAGATNEGDGNGERKERT